MKLAKCNCSGGVETVWIIGLSSSGKSTLARLLVKRLWDNGVPNILLDGDQIRDVFDERLGYDIESRRKQTRRVMRLTKWVSAQGIIPVVAIIHPCEEDRRACRNSLRGYFEVYLKCDLKVCAERDTKGVYAPAMRGETKNVVGLDIPYEDPKSPDLVIKSDRRSPEEMLETLWDRIGKRIIARVENRSQYQRRSIPCAE